MLEQSEVRLLPMNAVVAFGVATHLPADLQSSLRDAQCRAAVIHAVEFAVANHAVVSAAGPFPGRIVDDRNLARNRCVHASLRIGQLVNQVTVDKQLSAHADLNWFLCLNRRRQQDQCDGKCAFHSGSRQGLLVGVLKLRSAVPGKSRSNSSLKRKRRNPRVA